MKVKKYQNPSGSIQKINNNWYEQFKKEHPTITEVASYLPVMGSAMDVYEAINNPTMANISNAAISVGSDIFGYRLLKNAGKAYKALKASRKIEYDDLIRRGFGRTYARERTRPNLLYDPEYTRYGNALLGTQAGDKIINYSQNRMEKEKSRKQKASQFKSGGKITINNIEI